MLNVDDFIKRIEILLDYYGLSASVFADKLGVQRSGLSHLMSGRNKPSLDFVMKIAESFPEVDLYWLLNGTGDFPKKEGVAQSFVQPIVQQAPAPVQPQAEPEEPAMQDLFSAAAEAPHQPKPDVQPNDVSEKISAVNAPGDIDRIVVFYKNGVFKNYNPNN